MSLKPRAKPPAAGMGRIKGVPNKATLEVKAFCRGLIATPAYQAKLTERLEKGKLPPAIEALVWHYAYGKPKESVEVSTPSEGLTIRHIFSVEAAK